MRQATLALLRRAKNLPPLSHNLAAPCIYWGAVFFFRRFVARATVAVVGGASQVAQMVCVDQLAC